MLSGQHKDKNMAFKVYTKTGDKGETGLFGGKRLPKSHLRIESYGTVDELNSYIGLVKDYYDLAVLKEIQDRLFSIGGMLATDPDKKMMELDLSDKDIKILETFIDQWEEELPALKNFILPGGHSTVSFCHIARCVCRRAERRVVALAMEEEVPALIVQYLNRLSDFLFVLSRKIGKDLGVSEVIWKAR